MYPVPYGVVGVELVESWGPKCLFKALWDPLRLLLRAQKLEQKRFAAHEIDMKCKLCGVKETNKYRQKRDKKKETQISPFL